MNILLLGSGGREHAFAWKMNQSPLCSRIFIAPGNAGTMTEGTNLNLKVDDFDAIKEAIREYEIEMVVVGPELPLVKGIYDEIKSEPDLKDVKVIGPSKAAAALEGSKAFAKSFMNEFGIPTAAYREFTLDNLQEGLDYIADIQPPVVLKADGLAEGKGVLILDDNLEAQEELKEMLGGKFGEAGSKVVIEEFLSGIEFSVFALTDGKDYVLLPVAKDYKRIGEGDTGLNTGGMGAVSHPPFVTEAMMEKVKDRIIEPTIRGIRERGMEYVGFIFFGLIDVGGEPFVIEYNCRMGDPETEVVLPRIKSDWVDLMKAAAEGTLSSRSLEMDERATTTVFLVSGGYPEAYEKGKLITGLEQTHGSLIFHAGTKEEMGEIVTNGGRVIAITSYGSDFRDALEKCYANAELIHFDRKNYRRDVGFDLK